MTDIAEFAGPTVVWCVIALVFIISAIAEVGAIRLVRAIYLDVKENRYEALDIALGSLFALAMAVGGLMIFAGAMHMIGKVV